MYQKYTTEARNNYIQLYSRGQSVMRIAYENDVPKSTLYYWLNCNW